MRDLKKDWQDRAVHTKVWALAVPMILSNISVPLVALVDSAVVGHLPHAHQLAAVAVGAAMYSFLVSVLGFLRMGTTGFAAQAVGRNDGAGLRQVLAQGLLLAMLLAAVVALAAWPLGDVALRLANASPDLDAATRDFFDLRLWGLPAALSTYALVGWFLGVQNARAPLVILLATNLTNIALNLWFVVGLQWGILGSARASVISEWGGAVLGVVMTGLALRNRPGAMPWLALQRWASWKALLSVNRDIFIRSVALQVVFVFIAIQGARLGDSTVAANALLLNGLLLASHALDGLAHAVEALCGHAIGAGDRAALRQSLSVAAGWSLLCSLGFVVFFLVAGHVFIDLQTNIQAVRETAYPYLPYLAFLPLLAVWSYLLDGLFIGATRAAEMRNGMLLSIALVAPLAWVLRPWGNHGLWISFLAFMLLRGVSLGAMGWRLQQHDAWVARPGVK